MEKENIKDLIKKKLTSRKFHVTLIGYVSATLFLYWGLLPPDLWVDFSKWLFAVYTIGNSFEHFTNQGIKVKTSSREKSTDTNNPESIPEPHSESK